MNGRKKVRGNRYPWKKWFSQGAFTLVRGVHFPEYVKPHGMSQTIRNAAGRLGYGVSVKIFDTFLKVKVYLRDQVRQTWNRKPDRWRSTDKKKGVGAKAKVGVKVKAKAPQRKGA